MDSPEMPSGYYVAFAHAHQLQLGPETQTKAKAKERWGRVAPFTGTLRYALLPYYPRYARTEATTDGNWLMWMQGDARGSTAPGVPPDLYHYQRIGPRGEFVNWLAPVTADGELHLGVLTRADAVYQDVCKFVGARVGVPVRTRDEQAFVIPLDRVREMFWHYFLGADVDWDGWQDDLERHGLDNLWRVYGLLVSTSGRESRDEGAARPSAGAKENG